MFSKYQLSKSITAHKDDVKACKFLTPDTIITVSRDGTVRRNGNEIFASNTFLNSLSINEGSIYIGSRDSSITKLDPLSENEVIYLGHSDNVTCLDSFNDLLASGSWDHTARVWLSPEDSLVFQGHTQNVWDVKFVNAEQLLTASADRDIKLWDITTQQPISVYKAHNDVVRSLAIISKDQFISAGNDGHIILWDFKSSTPVKSVVAHNSFIYSIANVGNSVFTCGEDRMLKIWDLDFNCLQTIVLPAVSQWCVSTCENGDFVVGSSDNVARVFTQVENRFASSAEIQQFNDLVRNSAMSENEIDESQISANDVITKPGKHEGQVVMIKEGSDLVAYQFTQEKWLKLGSVVGSNQTSSSKKQELNNQSYDYVFDVDVADNQPPLKLPFNNGDNVYETAEKFLADNNLPASYKDQVVQFIINNTSAASIQAAPTISSSAPAAPTTSSASAPTTGTTSSTVPTIFQYSKLLPLNSFQPAPLLKALSAVTDPTPIEELLNALPSSGDELLVHTLSLLDSESLNADISKLLPVYDLLRVSISQMSTPPNLPIWVKLISAIDPSIPKHTLLAIRGVNNVLARPDFEFKSTSKSMLIQILEMFKTTIPALPHTKPLAIALSTLFLNLSVLNLLIDNNSISYKTLFDIIQPFITSTEDPESVYRFTLAVGIRKFKNNENLPLAVKSGDERTQKLLKYL